MLVSFGSTISFGPWWGSPSDFLPGPPTLDPLPIDGLPRANGSGNDCEQDGPTKLTVKLRRNGAEIDEFVFAPSWATETTYQVGAPANATINSGQSATLTLRGPGGGLVWDTGIPSQIIGGTVTLAEEVTP